MTTTTSDPRTASVTRRRVRGPIPTGYGAATVVPMPALERADRDAVLPALVGTVVWAAALLVLLIFRDRLVSQGEGWWLSVGVLGLLTGILFSLYALRRRRRLDGIRHQ